MENHVKITIDTPVHLNSSAKHLTAMIEEMLRHIHPDVEISVKDHDGPQFYELAKRILSEEPSKKKFHLRNIGKVVIESRQLPPTPYSWEKLSGLAVELPPGVVTLVPASNDSMGLLLSEQASPEEIVKGVECDDVFTPTGVKGPSRDP